MATPADALSVRNLDARTVQRAFSLFLVGKSTTEIAILTQFSPAQIRRLSKEYAWPERKAELINTQSTSLVDRMRALIDSNMEVVAARHLALTEKLDGHIETNLDKPKVGPRALSELSRALSNSAAVAGNVVGLTKMTEATPRPMAIQFNLQVQVGGDGEVSKQSLTITTAEPARQEAQSALPALTAPSPVSDEVPQPGDPDWQEPF